MEERTQNIFFSVTAAEPFTNMSHFLRCILLILFLACTASFSLTAHSRSFLRRSYGLPLPPSSLSRSPSTLFMLPPDSFSSTSSSIIVAVGDYAAEIEAATVGTEVYTPIFQAGLFIFLSGFISAIIAAFIISKSNSWDDIENEFQLGKEAQLIKSELLQSKEDSSSRTTSESEKTEAEKKASQVLQEVQDLDI